MTDKFLITFYDIKNNVALGRVTLPLSVLEKLNVGDKIGFKDMASILGEFTIQSFVVNQGHPEGQIIVAPATVRAKIRLTEPNNEYIDQYFPF